MVDLQTYRVRIANGPNMMSKILHRKVLRYKWKERKAQRHEDEDLLRKLLKTLPKSYTSYLVLIVLLLAIHVAKYSRTLPAVLFAEYSDIQQIFSSQQKTLLTYTSRIHPSVDFAVESILTLIFFGVSVSSIGVVHFIAILLLIAGVEPNPGPKRETHFRHEVTTKTTSLDERSVGKLSELITDYDMLYCVGIHLNIPYHIIRELDSTSRTVRETASKMLKTWFKTQPHKLDIILKDQLKNAFMKAGLKVNLTLTPNKSSVPLKYIRLSLDQTNSLLQAYQHLLKNIEKLRQVGLLDQSKKNPQLWVEERLNSLLSLQFFRSLYSSNSGLTNHPGLTSSSHLETLDVSDHCLTIWDLENSRLLFLSLEGNPIEDVNINIHTLPSFLKSTTGFFPPTFFSLDTIRKIGDEVLKLHVIKHFRDSCMLQPLDISTIIDLRHSFDVQSRNFTLTKWLQNTFHSYQELDLSNQREMLEFTALEFLFTLPSVSNIRILILRNCELRNIPNIEHLKSLQSLDVSENYITEVNAQSASLETVDLRQNPIVFLDINPHNFPRLMKITAGSSHTRYISLGTLRTLNVVISDEFKGHLHLPSAEVLADKEKLEQYIKAPETFLGSIRDTDDRIQALQWLLMRNPRGFETFSLAGQPKLVRDNPLVLSYVSLQNTTSLDISKCNISHCPHLNYLNGLRSLNISDNYIRTLKEIEKCRFLQHLNIVGNPIEVVDCETDLFQTLKTLQIGSSNTRVISPNVLKRALKKKLKLHVLVNFRKDLLCPTYSLLCDFDKLETFVTKPEIVLKMLPDESKVQVFSWLVRSFREFPLELDLSEMSVLFDHHVADETNRVLTNFTMYNLKTLNLHNCSLKVVPNLDRLNSLETLDLSYNLLECGLETLHLKSLESLRLEGNPIRTVEMNLSSLPSLNELSCGSVCTTQISFSVLNRVVDGKLKIIFPTEFKNYLKMPPHNTLENAESMRKYLQQPQIVISGLLANEMERTLVWLLNQSTEFCSLNLSCQEDLCEKTIASLLYEPNLQRIVSLYLESCQLSRIPNVRHLSNLRALSLKDNRLTKMDSEYLPHCLESMNISGNPIEDIDIPMGRFLSLKHVAIGSRATKFVSLEIMKACALQKFNLSVCEPCDQTLLLPPREILTDKNLLTEYIKSPEKALSYISDVDQKWEALQWLINKYGNTFRSFSLEGQLDLCDDIDHDVFQEVLKKLPEVENLTLSRCNITAVTDISYLNKLKVLDISDNNIRELPPHLGCNTLENLNISGNKIIQVDVANFKLLTKLTCGSLEPWNISSPTLREISNGTLSVWIPLAYQETLLFPKYKILESGVDAIKSFLEYDELDLTEIKTPHDDLSYYQSVVDNAEKSISSLRLSAIPFLLDLLQNTALKRILYGKKVNESLRFLYLDSCNLKEFPRELFIPELLYIDISYNNLIEEFDQNLPPIIGLKAEHCNLSKLPQVKSLESINIQNNRISKLKTNVVYPNLKYLNIARNDIVSIDFNPELFPKLERIRLGSRLTKYISSRILELAANGQIEIHLDSEYRHHLILPPAEVLTDSVALKRYVHAGGQEKYLIQLEDESKIEALMWLIGDEGLVIGENFNLSWQDNLCLRLQQKGLENLFTSEKLKNVKVLCLDHCGLIEIPNTETLPLLSTLSVVFNNIEYIDDIRHPAIQHLLVQDNPIESVHFTPSNLLSLIHVTCGSEVTREISLTVLEQVSKGLNIEIVPKFQDCLKGPPSEILNQGITGVLKYLNKRELDLSAKHFGMLSMKPMKKMIQYQEQNIKILRVSGQRNVFKTRDHALKILSLENLNGLEELYMDDCALSEMPDVGHFSCLKRFDISTNLISFWYLRSPPDLPYLHTLRLNQCGLDTFLAITCFPLLKHLELRENKLKDLNFLNIQTYTPKVHPLETLDLSGNPVQEISIEMESYPVLKHLACGSFNTHYISFPLMNAVRDDRLTINIPEPYNKYLLIPPELDDVKGLGAFLKETVINLEWITDAEQRRDALLWLLKNEHLTYTTLVLTKQYDFCLHTNLDLPKFLRNSYLANIRFLYLDGCKLTQNPLTKGALPQLELLDVSNNKLIQIFDDTKLSHPKLSKLYLQDNPIDTAEIENISKLPRLKYIKIGSEYTRHIGNTLLDRVVLSELKIEIPREHRKVLVQPPYEVLMLGAKTLKAYLNDGKMRPEDPSYVWKSTTDNVLMLLGETGSGKTSLLRSMKANSLKLTDSNSRTISLDRSHLDLGHNITTTTLDFGGHDIYELEYPMFLRGQNIIVLILVDIFDYCEDKHDSLVAKWLHICALEASDCKVLFVPSKTDTLLHEEVTRKVDLMTKQIQKSLQKEIALLNNMMTKLRDNYLKGLQPDLQRKRGHYYCIYKQKSAEIKKSIRYLRHFNITILPTSSKKMEGIVQLKTKLRYLVEIREVLLPVTWKKILQVIKDSKSQFRFYSSFKQVRTSLTENIEISDNITENMEECLRYLSNKGVVWWYKEDPEYIFNRIENVLHLYKVLFRDDLQEKVSFKKSFNTFISNEAEFQEEKDRFLSSGLMRRNLLECMWLSFNLSGDEMTTMIKLLKFNDQCFEKELEVGKKLTAKISFLQFPWFVPRSTTHYDWSNKLPGSHLELCYVYTYLKRFPSAFFERLRVRLQQILTHRHDRIDWADGIFVKMNTVKLLIQKHTRHQTNPQLTVRLRAPSTDLILLWELCLKSYNDVVNELATESALVTYDYICPHCILGGCSIDAAYKLPLPLVMESRCDDEDQSLCLCPGTYDTEPVALPAALLEPLTKETAEIERHLHEVKEFCFRFTEAPDVMLQTEPQSMNEKDLKETASEETEQVAEAVESVSAQETKREDPNTSLLVESKENMYSKLHDMVNDQNHFTQVKQITVQENDRGEILDELLKRSLELATSTPTSTQHRKGEILVKSEKSSHLRLTKVILDQFEFAAISKIPTQKCQMWMLRGPRMYTGILCRGEGGVLQGPGSSVQLQIPENVHGLVIGSVCTDNSEFSKQIPKDECIIAPMVEFELHSILPHTMHEHEPRHHYMITIPHCVDDDSAWDLIKVRKFNSNNTDELVDITQYNASQSQDTYYVIEEQSIRIYTKHFCNIICSTCQQSKCRDSAMVFFYGSIQPSHEGQTSILIKPFFCSFLFNIADYRQNLNKLEENMGYRLIESYKIKNDKLVENCQVEICITDLNKKWQPRGNDAKFQWDSKQYILKAKKLLGEIMEFSDEHLCHSVTPSPAAIFRFTTQSSEKMFDGKLEIKIHKKPDSIPFSFGLIDLKVTGPITDQVISKLARNISHRDMEFIAIELLDFSLEDVETWTDVHKNSLHRFNLKILSLWSKKDVRNTKYVLAQKLYKAAEKGLGNCHIIEPILGIPPPVEGDKNNNLERSSSEDQKELQGNPNASYRYFLFSFIVLFVAVISYALSFKLS